MDTGEIQGLVNRVDVRYFGDDEHIRCFAWVNPNPDEQIQVVTDEARLQSALEMAAILKAPTEITFRQSDPEADRVVTGVRILE